MIVPHNPSNEEPLGELVLPGEWPSPPWESTQFSLTEEYAPATPQWFAQKTALWALRNDFHAYSTRDIHKEERERVARLLAQSNQAPQQREEHKEKHTPRMTRRTPSHEERPLESHIAVVTDTHVYFSSEGKLVRRELPGEPALPILLQLAMDLRVRTLWVLPGTGLSQGASRAWGETSAPGWKLKNASYKEVGRERTQFCTCLVAYKLKESRHEGEHGDDIAIMFPEHEDAWVLDEVRSPVTLLKAITYLEDALGVEVRYKPQTVGRRYMIERNRKNTDKGWIQPVNIVKALPQKATVTKDQWVRTLTPAQVDELIAQGYIHAIAVDKNSQWPASCTSVKLGVGAPVYVELPLWEKKTGLYHCTITGETAFNGRELPHPTGGVLDGWFYTYTVELLVDWGYSVEIHEAYIWNEAHTILRTWVEELWGARCSLNSTHDQCKRERYKDDEARELAYESVKPILNSSLGMLGAGVTRDKLPELEARLSDPTLPEREKAHARENMAWYRPDWYALIVDRAWVTLLRRVKKLIDEGAPALLLGVLTDCLYYAVTSPDYDQALPGILAKSGSLGGFKPKFSRPIPLEELRDELTRARATVGKLNDAMQAIDQESEER